MDGRLQRTVGGNVRRIRQGMGLSQVGLSRYLGLHRTYVGGIERGERNVSLRIVERLSEQLGVHVLDLLWDDEALKAVTGPDGTTRIVAKQPKADKGTKSAKKVRQ